MGSRGQSRAEPTELRLPDRYRVRRRLATGGMASVWCAEDLVLGRTVAVKVLAERFAYDDMAMRRFKREARAAARVSTHAHVVTIYDVGDLEADARDVESVARPFIVMEYLAGGTVADAIRVGAVRRQEAVRWIREAASALDHAHARGIVHRDIKPANFLLNRSRVLHVADFGIARLVSEDTITSTGELFGTAAYLSPEQALGREATGASDRYSLTVAAFELLAGERPFEAQHFAAQARQHIEDERPYASERDRTLPPTVDEVLIRGMAKEPDERFETAGEFVDALETALSGGIAVTTQRPASQRRRSRAPGHHLGVPAVGASANGGGRGALPRTRADRLVAPPLPRPQLPRSHRLVERGQLDPARILGPPAHGTAGRARRAPGGHRRRRGARTGWARRRLQAPHHGGIARHDARQDDRAPAPDPRCQGAGAGHHPRGFEHDHRPDRRPHPADRRAAPTRRPQRVDGRQLPAGDRHPAQGAGGGRQDQPHLRLRPL